MNLEESDHVDAISTRNSFSEDFGVIFDRLEELFSEQIEGGNLKFESSFERVLYIFKMILENREYTITQLDMEQFTKRRYFDHLVIGVAENKCNHECLENFIGEMIIHHSICPSFFATLFSKIMDNFHLNTRRDILQIMSKSLDIFIPLATVVDGQYDKNTQMRHTYVGFINVWDILVAYDRSNILQLMIDAGYLPLVNLIVENSMKFIQEAHPLGICNLMCKYKNEWIVPPSGHVIEHLNESISHHQRSFLSDPYRIFRFHSEFQKWRCD